MNARNSVLTACAALAAIVAAGAWGLHAQTGAPLALKWADLMPPAPPKPPKAFFSGRAPVDPQAPSLPESIPEGRWMSKPAAAAAPAPVVESLNGKRVQIGGYVVPLDFEANSVKEFLLVPFVGACIHVPPPPANQIVYVKMDQPIEVKGQFTPVWVTGTLRTELAFTGLADAGYSISAAEVKDRRE